MDGSATARYTMRRHDGRRGCGSCLACLFLGAPTNCSSERQRERDRDRETEREAERERERQRDRDRERSRERGRERETERERETRDRDELSQKGTERNLTICVAQWGS